MVRRVEADHNNYLIQVSSLIKNCSLQRSDVLKLIMIFSFIRCSAWRSHVLETDYNIFLLSDAEPGKENLLQRSDVWKLLIIICPVRCSA